MSEKRYRALYRDETNGYICGAPSQRSKPYSPFLNGESYKGGESGELFRVRTAKGETARKIIPMLRGLKFRDFIGEFYDAPYYCAVFNYREGETLHDEIGGGLSPAERYGLAKSVMKTVIVKNLPPEVLAGVLTERNILTGPDNSVSFDYAFPVAGADAAEVYKRLSEIIGGIMGGYMTDEFQTWLKKLRAGGFGHICEAYFRMPEFKEKVSTPPLRKPALREKTAAFAAAAERLQPVLAALAAAAVTVFSVWFFGRHDEEQPETARGNIAAIGIVEIEE
ncbi:MAG: hypothetical protein LBI38_02790 [Oscillospiraceae bacterium]|jgi:hypothetical protein|nr:hypothetical protein [Oscillospiraceae bacterium]